jgi:hypothetical protein
MTGTRVSRSRHPRRSGDCIDRVAGHAPEAAIRSYCARRSRDSYSVERQGLRPRVICTDTYPSDNGKQPVNALTAHLADLQKPDGLDTRGVYLILACFRSSQARSA